MKSIKIDYSDDSTKLNVQSLGDIVLKFISFSDLQKISQIIRFADSNKVAAQAILHLQLRMPDIPLEEFKAIPEKDMLKILSAFVKKESHIFEHFSLSDDPYTEFIKILREYQRKRVEQFTKVLMPNFQAVSKSLASIAKQYQSVTLSPAMQSILKNAVAQSKMTQSLSASLPKLNGAFLGLQKSSSAVGSIKPLIDAQTSAARSISKILAPNMKIWQTWAQTNSGMFSQTISVLKALQDEYRISRREAVEVLAKYKWFVSPSLDAKIIYQVSQLNKQDGNQSKAINKLFIDYFEKDEWKILDRLINNWRNNELFRSRYKILSDTFMIIRMSSTSNVNVTNSVLPTLIVQIDGILKDLMKQHIPKSFNDHNKIKTFKDSGLMPNMSDLDQLGMDVFLDILFQSSNPGTPLKTPFNLNRHKILHAENTRYGRKDYLVRVIMVLDILAHLEVDNSSLDV